jgi:DNA invertase Pin-like site-specific DNA recombinase
LGEPEIIVDEGLSGYKATRPGYLQLRERCLGGDATHVIITDLSRLSRSVRDTLAFVDEIVEKHRVRLICLNLDLDTGTPFGRAFLTFVAVFAQLYRDDISYRTRVALAHKKSKGERYSGMVPYGLEENHKGNLVPSSSDMKLMERISDLRASGRSLRQIALQLEQEGYRTKRGSSSWSPQVISDLVARAVRDRGS